MTTPSPLTGTFEDVAGENRALARKMQKMAVLLGNEDAPVIESIVDTDNELVIPAGYQSVGHVSRDTGASITPSLDVSTLDAYNDGQPIRRDVNSRTTTLGFTMLESKRLTFEVYHGISLAGIQATAGTKNEVKFDQPDLPDMKYWRVLLLGRDGRGANAIYHAEHFLLMALSDVAERTWSPTEGFVWPVTMAAETDDGAGTPQRSFWAGPGLTAAKLTAMGFTKATA